MPRPQGDPPSDRSARILVVDDSTTICSLVRTILEEAGHQIDTASSAMEALLLASERPYDVAFVDKNLEPEVDGFRLSRRLVALQPELGVVMMTGDPSMDVVVRAVEEEIVGFLHKPLDPAQVLRKAERVLLRRRQRAQSPTAAAARPPAATPVLSNEPPRFELLERLAVGGMAEVFLGRQHAAGGIARFVAVKRLLPNLAADRIFVEMFLQEARIAAQLSHPNCVQIIDVGFDGRDYFLAMEFLLGPTLSKINAALRRQLAERNLRLLAGIVLQACEGLHHAHELRLSDGSHVEVVHRDVSPQNIIVTTSGVAKLIDFGIAKARMRAAELATRGNSLKGKYPYMSPEQVRGAPVDRRTDVFAAGVVLYEVMTGVLPFGDANGDVTTLQNIASMTPTPPSQINPEVDPALEAVCLRALEKSPERRFQTAQELAEGLRDALRYRGGAPSHSECAALPAVLATVIREQRKVLEGYAETATVVQEHPSFLDGEPPAASRRPGDDGP